MAQKKSDILESLISQLEKKQADISCFLDLIDDYMALYDIKKKLKTDIKKRGVSYEAQSASGKATIIKQNQSVKDLVAVNKQMLMILDKLGLTTEKREKPGEDVQRVSTVEITDQQVRDAVTEICLRELAFWTCVGKIANALTKCEFRTFYEGEELFKDEYYLWNYEPNRNQNKAEFLSKAMEQLFRNNELLIVESYDGQLLVADDFSVTKNALYGDTYTNVQVDNYTFSRSFRSSDVLHWTLNNKNVNRIIQHLYDSYSKLIDYSAKSYLKSRGSRGTLNISAVAQSDKLFNEKLEKLMNEYFKSFFESPNAVLPLFEGYSYTDIGSKTYSEGTSRDIKSQYDDIFDFTARGFSMPPTLAILYVAAGLKVAGTKQAVRETENYGEKSVYCYETPTPYFGDIGSGEIAADGKCYVDIEDILKEMINTEMQYYVFLQKRGEGDLYVSECSPDYFIVTGTPGLKFFWELKAKQKGYEYNRYEGEDRVVGFRNIAYDDEYIAETEKLIEEREEI